jgi:hypothetical protein
MNNCFHYNNKNYSCTVCKPPYGEENGLPKYDCYAPKAVKTNFDVITESVENLVEEIVNIQCNVACGIVISRESYRDYLNQKVQNEEYHE